MEQTITEERVVESPPPRRFYYGWVMLPVAVAGMIASSPGQTFGIAAFNESFRASLGLSHSQLTGAYMLGTLLASLPLTYVGLLMDRHGLRRTTFVAVLLLAFGCYVASLANGLFTLFLAFFLLRLIGPGTLTLLSSTTLAYWFHRRLGTVEGIRQMGMALAIASIPTLDLWLIDRLGWRNALVALGGGVCALMLPLVIVLFRNRPEDVGQQMDNGPAKQTDEPGPHAFQDLGPQLSFSEAFRTRSFWIVLGINALWALVGTAISFNIVPIFQAQGLDERAAAGLLGIFALSLAVTHLIGGILADRVPLHWLLVVATACMALSVAALGWLEIPWMSTGSGLAMGLSQGLSLGITSVICLRYFGRTHLGQIRGALSTAVVAASSAGPFLVGLSRDLTGSYSLILFLFTVAAVLSCGAAFFATPPHRSNPLREADLPAAPLALDEVSA